VASATMYIPCLYQSPTKQTFWDGAHDSPTQWQHKCTARLRVLVVQKCHLPPSTARSTVEHMLVRLLNKQQQVQGTHHQQPPATATSLQHECYIAFSTIDANHLLHKVHTDNEPSFTTWA